MPPLTNANETLGRIHEIVVLYVSFSANLHWYLIHSSPIPPVELKTRGGEAKSCSRSTSVTLAWSTMECAQHTHTDRLSGIAQAYRNLNASLNSRFFRSKSISLRGITVNQSDDPFSLANSAILYIFSGSETFTLSRFSRRPSSLTLCIRCCSSYTSASSAGSCRLVGPWYKLTPRTHCLRSVSG